MLPVYLSPKRQPMTKTPQETVDSHFHPVASPESKAQSGCCEGEQRLKILLAEDSLINQKVALNQLKSLGYEADVAANGQEVIALIAKNNYDLVLMDCQMPVMDGYEATHTIRHSSEPFQQVIIVAMTASAMKDDHAKCLEAGMDDYLCKPVHRDALAAKLADWSNKILSKQRNSDQHQTKADNAEQQNLHLLSNKLLDKKLINWNYLHELSGNNEAFERELLQTLVETLPKHLEALKIAISKQDGYTIEREGHYIRGSSASVGAIALETLAAQLETRAYSGASETDRALFFELVATFEHIQEAVRAK